MKKKLLPLAMLAGLPGTAGPAHVVHINAASLGPLRCPPPLESRIKVHLLEQGIGQEVLDFNLYLSPELI